MKEKGHKNFWGFMVTMRRPEVFLFRTWRHLQLSKQLELLIKVVICKSVYRCTMKDFVQNMRILPSCPWFKA